MEFGAFSPFGLMGFGATASTAESYYRSMKKSVELAYSVEEGTHVEATIYARAMAYATVRATLRHAFNQRRPSLVDEMLPALERTFGLSPSITDTLTDRRTALAARKRILRGSSHSSLASALQAVLGADYVGLASYAATATPAAPGDVGSWDAPQTPSRIFRLLTSVPVLNVPLTVQYEPVVSEDETIEVGDRMTIATERFDLAEAVTFTAVNNAVTPHTATAVFTRSHDAGETIQTHAPMWRSAKRHIVVVLRVAAAVDPVIRRRVHELMRRAVRGTTTWSIAQESTPGFIGPFTVGTSPIGAVPIGVALPI